MKLETKRLALTEMQAKDIADIHHMNSFPEVAEFNTIGIPTDISQTEELKEHIVAVYGKKDKSVFGWAVRDRETGDFIGEVGMNLSTPKYNMGEIYYNLLPIHWGKGYASEAVKSVLKFGFEDLGLHRIEAGVATGNANSIKLLERVGMTREGRRRKILPIRGEWKDNFMYSILVEDPRNF